MINEFVKWKDINDFPITWKANFGSQMLFLSCPYKEVFYSGTRAVGKAQPLDSFIITPSGLKQMKDMKIGKQINNPDGSISKIIGIYPQGIQDIYELEFEDGTKTRCTKDHLWYGKVTSEKIKRNFKNNCKIFTTEMIINRMEKNKNWKQNYRLMIPLTKPVEFNYGKFRKYPMKIDPYLLGLLIGDGYINNGYIKISNKDKEIIDFLLLNNFYHSDGIQYSIKDEPRKILLKQLNKLNLYGKLSDEKFIPNEYKFGNIATRIKLIQGLFDTDGYVAKNGCVQFTSVSKRLIDDVIFIIQSLGGQCFLHEKQGKYKKNNKIINCKQAYTITIQIENKSNLFNITRKKERCIAKKFSLMKILKSIKFIGKEKAQCLKIDNPNGLYLTDNFIVTHNSEALLFDFFKDVGKGYGSDWRGVIFRKSFPELKRGLVIKSKKYFRSVCPEAKFNHTDSCWEFPDGELLFLSQFENENDYDKYHGQEFQFIGWDELVAWPNLNGYEAMKSCNRRSNEGIPLKIRSTGNPWGIGRTAVMAYFIDPAPWGTPINNKNKKDKRVTIHGNMVENLPFMAADPTYRDTILGLSDSNLVKAWGFGRWDINIGGYFSDVWNSPKHVIPINRCFTPPSHWLCFRSFDWGSAAPFSVGWWCVSDGTTAPNGITYPRGALIRFAEWYGCNKEALKDGKVNVGIYMTNQKIGDGIREREKQWPKLKIRRGPAGTDLFKKEGGPSFHDQMGGNLFLPADTTRIAGWQQMRIRFEGDVEGKPLLYFMEWCVDSIRTIPYLQRDEKKLEDIDTQQEDHCADETRYACMYSKIKKDNGMFNTADLFFR